MPAMPGWVGSLTARFRRGGEPSPAAGSPATTDTPDRAPSADEGAATVPHTDAGFLALPPLGSATGPIAHTIQRDGTAWMSTWRQPTFMTGVDHLVDPDAPSGVVADLIRPGQPRTRAAAQDLTLAPLDPDPAEAEVTGDPTGSVTQQPSTRPTVTGGRAAGAGAGTRLGTALRSTVQRLFGGSAASSPDVPTSPPAERPELVLRQPARPAGEDRSASGTGPVPANAASAATAPMGTAMGTAPAAITAPVRVQRSTAASGLEPTADTAVTSSSVPVPLDEPTVVRPADPPVPLASLRTLPLAVGPVPTAPMTRSDAPRSAPERVLRPVSDPTTALAVRVQRAPESPAESVASESDQAAHGPEPTSTPAPTAPSADATTTDATTTKPTTTDATTGSPSGPLSGPARATSTVESPTPVRPSTRQVQRVTADQPVRPARPTPTPSAAGSGDQRPVAPS